jgi:5-methyltetrahydropteroyltriglutamate--homocysteine methyltransferase
VRRLSDLFRTQEVGSLSRAPFLKKPGSPESAEMALYWGRMLKVEGHELLYGSLRDGSFTQDSLLEWASLYGIRFHEAAGLDVVYDGEQRRVEMYEHLMQKVENAVFLGRMKVWDAETYRKAAIIGIPRLKSSAYLEEFLFVKSKARREVKVPVTGPYTLMDWSYDEFYVTRQNRELGPLERRKRAREEMLYDLVENVVRPELRALVEAGARRIQIDEPALTTKPEEVELYVEAFNEMVKGIDATFTLHVCYSDYSKLFPRIAEMRVDEFSIECANRDSLLPGVSDDARRGYSVLRLFREHSIGAKVAPGVTDVHTDFVEPPELVRDRLLYAARILDDPEKVIACHDCGLRTRRWEVAFEKEKALVKGAELARREFSGR